MNIFKKMRMSWTMKTKREKTQAIVRFIDGICNSVIFGILGNAMKNEDDGFAKKAAIDVGMFGLSLAATDIVGGSTDEIVDAFFDGVEEGAANGGA